MCWRSDDMMISVDKWSWCQWHVMKWPETWRRHFRWKRTCWVGYGASVVQWHWLNWINPLQCDCDLCIVKCVDDLMTWSVLTSDHEMNWNLKTTFPVKKNLLSWVECKKHLSSRPINEFKPQENIIDIQRVHQSCECRCESVLWYIPDYILYTYIFNEWSSEAVLFFSGIPSKLPFRSSTMQCPIRPCHLGCSGWAPARWNRKQPDPQDLWVQECRVQTV